MQEEFLKLAGDSWIPLVILIVLAVINRVAKTKIPQQTKEENSEPSEKEINLEEWLKQIRQEEPESEVKNAPTYAGNRQNAKRLRVESMNQAPQEASAAPCIELTIPQEQAQQSKKEPLKRTIEPKEGAKREKGNNSRINQTLKHTATNQSEGKTSKNGFETSSEAQMQEFNLREAIIYSEILKPKFEELENN